MTKLKRKRLILSLLSVGIMIFIIVQHIRVEQHAKKYQWAQAKQGQIEQTVTAVGNIEPVQLVTVTSMISGTVDKIFHDEGDFVKAGTRLLQIKPNPTPADVAQAKRTLEQREVDEKSALATLNRYKSGINAGAVSKDQFTKAKQAYKDALVQRQLAREQLALLVNGNAKVDGNEVSSTITSPITGFILSRYVDLGGNVIAQTQSMQGKVLYTIANMKDLLFKGQVDEIDVAKLKVGMPATIQIAAVPGEKIKGKLHLIALQSESDADSTAGISSNASSTTMPFNVGFDVQINHLSIPHTLKLRAGYSATARITVKTLKQVLLIPESAIIPGNGHSATVYLKSAQSLKPVKKTITIGIADGMHVQVVKGLHKGDSVLLTPPLKKVKAS